MFLSLISEHINLVYYYNIKVQDSNDSLDPENKWKGHILYKSYQDWYSKNKLQTDEFDKAMNHMYRLNLYTWIAFPVFIY
jgi:hypothetical protein